MGLYKFNPEDAYAFANTLPNNKVKTRGNELQFQECPYCHGRGRGNAYTFSFNLQTGQFKCLRASCGAHGNMITISKDFRFSLGTEVDEYYNSQRQYRNIHTGRHYEIKPAAIAYLESRGISAAITKRYGITTQDKADNILVFPFKDENSILTFVKYRKTDFDKTKDKNKEWCERDCKPILFGMDQCNMENDTLILTEGQIDSLSVSEAGIENAVSVPTGAKGFTWIPYCWDFLNQFKTLIVFGDHEKGHITLLEEMKSRFHGAIMHVREEDYMDCKDANEILKKYGKDAIRKAIANAVPVKNRRILKVSEVERMDLSKLPKINTGMQQLNKITGGMYLGQLALLTGDRGDGKSTFASQLGIMAIKEGYPVFFYSGELMGWYFKEWLERQMAGAKHINKIDDEFGRLYSVDANVLGKITNWYENKAYLYNNDIVQDGDTEEESILKTMESAITQYGCKVMIIDNLMTAMEDDISSDIYRQQSNFVKSLAAMAKKFNVLIILIAHPKKRDGIAFSNDSIAGSSNITNLCDIIMRYTRPPVKHAPLPKKDQDDDGENETEKEALPAPVKGPDRLLQITKNRMTGKLDTDGIPLYFQESSKRISENPETFDFALGWEEQKEEWSPVSDDDELPFGGPED